MRTRTSACGSIRTYAQSMHVYAGVVNAIRVMKVLRVTWVLRVILSITNKECIRGNVERRPE